MASSPPPRKLVVAGLIARPDQRILVSQRREDQAMPLGWEFPGGKIELGESPEQALRRELREELDIEVEVHRIWEVLHYQYADFELLMLVYSCALAPGSQPRCRQVRRISWCSPEELRDLDFLPADRALVERLAREGVPRALPR